MKLPEIAVRRHIGFFVQALLITSVKRTAEAIYLIAHIIYVVFLFRRVASRSENIG